MKNVTITLDEQVARWVRIRAAELGKSVSRLVGDLLRERMVEEDDYQAAMKQYLSQSPRPLKQSGARYASREELHSRPGLR
jgi:plasmid stability protein